MDDFWIIRGLLGREAARKYFDFRMFVAIISVLFGLVIATIIGAYYVATYLWNQIAIEIQYHQKYGAAWKEEYERYNGSLAQANARLLIVFLCLMALAVIFSWIAWRVHKSRRNHKMGMPPNTP